MSVKQEPMESTWQPEAIPPIEKLLVREDVFVKPEPEEISPIDFCEQDFLKTAQVKAEVADSLSESASKSCCLCPEGVELQDRLVQHYRQFHPDVTRNFVHQCDCEEGINLHESLANHLLSHFLGKSAPESSNLSTARGKKPDVLNVQKALEPEINFAESLPVCTPTITSDTKQPKTSQKSPKSKARLKHDCSLCPNESFETEIKWNNHMVECHFKDNDRISKLTCCKCFKTFASRILLLHHMIRHRKPNFECDLCGKKSNDKFRLKNHLFTHFRRKYGEHSKEFKKPNRNQTMCYVCSKMVDSITDHVYLRHSDEKRFKCNEPDCSFASKTKRSLQQHQNLHTGSRPHVCEFCGKKFATQGGLSNHRIRHINPEKFKCQTCGECFAGPESLKSHKARLHAQNDQVAEVRPHACSFEGCVSSFASERNLKVHVKNVHNKVFAESKCNVCPFVTNHPQNLRAHMKRFHCIKTGHGRLYPPQKNEDKKDE